MYSNYLNFLFTPLGELKLNLAPVVYYKKNTDSFILKYSIPGYHQPRQSFSFVSIPESFPNVFVETIFKFFSITDSLLFRHPSRIVPKPKQASVNKVLNIHKSFSQDEIDTANFNLNLAIKLGKLHHSLFFFDDYYNAFKILFPDSNLSKKQIQAKFNSLIS